jgi:hypothetical protein
MDRNPRDTPHPSPPFKQLGAAAPRHIASGLACPSLLEVPETPYRKQPLVSDDAHIKTSHNGARAAPGGFPA